jgi:hypothetical protein
MKNLLLLIFAITLFGCSSDDDSGNKFRNIYNNTFWIANGTVAKFSPDKLLHLYDANDECHYWEEGSFNNVDYDGCVYNNVTYVIIEEDIDTFVFREIGSDGVSNIGNNSGSFCGGQETTITFQVVSENAMEVKFSYTWDSGSIEETSTFVKTNNSFPVDGCINGTLNGYLF